jgi:hypothetical protein
MICARASGRRYRNAEPQQKLKIVPILEAEEAGVEAIKADK